MRTTARVIVTATILFSFYLSAFSQQVQVAKSIPNSTSPDGIIGFLEFRPSDYGSQKHPLIIFLHGVGERGNGSPAQVGMVAANAIPLFCSQGASMRFTVGGQTSSFVVLSPQLSTAYGYWQPFYVKEMIKYAKANLSIDPNRIYITGLSLGGGGVWRIATDADHTYDQNIAAIAPVCATGEESDGDYCATIGANHLPVWAFHCMDDQVVNVSVAQHVEAVSLGCGVTPAAKFTYYQSGNHWGTWLNAYDTGHKVAVLSNGSTFIANPNLYEWFLSNSRSGAAAPPPVVTAPVAYPGSAQIVTLPTSTATLVGSGAGTNGATITSYSWSKTAGPAGGNVISPNSATTSITGLVQGSYSFVLTVTDNNGLTDSKSVAITVNAASTSPVSYPGIAQTITLPTNTTTLFGSGAGTNGATISSYAWSKTGGPAGGNVVSPNAATTSITGLIQGSYTFVLTVTDNRGLTDSKAVFVTVNAASTVTAPIALPGNAQSIILPINSVTLTGSGTGTNGATISSYSWVQTDGPSSASIVSPNSMITTANNLIQGRYAFVLTVTDNHGLTDSKAVFITVIAGTGNTAPIASPSGAQTITLPTNSVTLWGAGSGTNGAVIISYSWIQTDGPATATVVSPNSVNTNVTNLVQGRYSFVLTVTDNHGLTNSKAVFITVNPSLAYTPPVAIPSNSQSLTLPANTVTLWGAGNGTNGAVIMSYSWVQTAGPSTANIASPNAIITQVTGLIQGRYTFVLTVTDNHGLTDSKAVFITVLSASGLRQAAGTDTLLSMTADRDALATALVKPVKLTLYPNPVAAAATIELYSAENSVKTINLYDVRGVLRAKYTWQTTVGNNIFSLKNIAGLSNGMYIIDIRDTQGKLNGSLKFLKIK